jgi:uncharacterized protein
MPFLTAQWLDLAILNWEVPAQVLTPFIPRGTELDRWRGQAFVSLVGFRFVDTRLLKVPIPMHVNFEEVNLRFYVKRECQGEIRRGVAFVKEIVPRRCIALVARTLYNENYVTAPMSHVIERNSDRLRVRYDWRLQGTSNSIAVESDGSFHEMAPGSHEEFIAEHYWGYCNGRDGRTIEYQVTHPRWQTAAVAWFSLTWDPVGLYGPELAEQMRSPPTSVYLANGSKVAVGFGQRCP